MNPRETVFNDCFEQCGNRKPLNKGRRQVRFAKDDACQV